MFRSVQTGIGTLLRRCYSEGAHKGPTLYQLFPKTFPNGQATWQVDGKRLRKEYRQLQSVHHPDVAEAGGEEDAASKLNHAYNTLTKPLFRSQYLLKLNGIDVTDEHTAQEIAQRDAELLMEVLDVHEQLEELLTEEDIKKLKVENRNRIEALEKLLGEVYMKQDWNRAAKLTVELKYWDNLDKAIKEWEPGKTVELKH